MCAEGKKKNSWTLFFYFLMTLPNASNAEIIWNDLYGIRRKKKYSIEKVIRKRKRKIDLFNMKKHFHFNWIKRERKKRYNSLHFYYLWKISAFFCVYCTQLLTAIEEWHFTLARDVRMMMLRIQNKWTHESGSTQGDTYITQNKLNFYWMLCVTTNFCSSNEIYSFVCMFHKPIIVMIIWCWRCSEVLMKATFTKAL